MRKLLIADDNEDFATLLNSLLTSEGFDTHTTFCGDTAIDYLKDNSDCSLIVSDIIMPGTDGFDLIDYASGNSSAKIIAMTGGGVHLSSNRALDTIKDKVDGTLTKPFQMSDLVEMVYDLLKE